jgi:DNA mismatch endonuclease, patch repair protein
MDVHSPEKRSANMSAIRGKDTKPEMIVRRMLHRLGYRYRIHRKDLPGRPDIVFPRLRKVIFVNGCFWHMHDCRYGCVRPATNAEFWQNKRSATVERDQKNLAALQKLGWDVLILWECWTQNQQIINSKLSEFLPPR